MSDRARAEKARRFWDLYIKRLHKQGINPPSDRWHVLRAEQFIKAFPEQHLRDHTPESVAAYLQTLGRQAALAGWQYRQAVRAIQILFSIVEPEWQSGFDWNYWLESAHTLEVGTPYRRASAAAGGFTGRARGGTRGTHRRGGMQGAGEAPSCKLGKLGKLGTWVNWGQTTVFCRSTGIDGG